MRFSFFFLLSTKETGVTAKTSKYVLTAARRFGVSVSGAKHRRRSVRRRSRATSKTRPAAAGARLTGVPHACTGKQDRRAALICFCFFKEKESRIQQKLQFREASGFLREERSGHLNLAAQMSVTCKHIAANVSSPPTSVAALRKRRRWIHPSVPGGGAR